MTILIIGNTNININFLEPQVVHIILLHFFPIVKGGYHLTIWISQEQSRQYCTFSRFWMSMHESKVDSNVRFPGCGSTCTRAK